LTGDTVQFGQSAWGDAQNASVMFVTYVLVLISYLITLTIALLRYEHINVELLTCLMHGGKAEKWDSLTRNWYALCPGLKKWSSIYSSLIGVNITRFFPKFNWSLSTRYYRPILGCSLFIEDAILGSYFKRRSRKYIRSSHIPHEIARFGCALRIGIGHGTKHRRYSKLDWSCQ
jgi:hypothetical protein